MALEHVQNRGGNICILRTKVGAVAFGLSWADGTGLGDGARCAGSQEREREGGAGARSSKEVEHVAVRWSCISHVYSRMLQPTKGFPLQVVLLPVVKGYLFDTVWKHVCLSQIGEGEGCCSRQLVCGGHPRRRGWLAPKARGQSRPRWEACSRGQAGGTGWRMPTRRARPVLQFSVRCAFSG